MNTKTHPGILILTPESHPDLFDNMFYKNKSIKFVYAKELKDWVVVYDDSDYSSIEVIANNNKDILMAAYWASSSVPALHQVLQAWVYRIEQNKQLNTLKLFFATHAQVKNSLDLAELDVKNYSVMNKLYVFIHSVHLITNSYTLLEKFSNKCSGYHHNYEEDKIDVIDHIKTVLSEVCDANGTAIKEKLPEVEDIPQWMDEHIFALFD